MRNKVAFIVCSILLIKCMLHGWSHFFETSDPSPSSPRALPVSSRSSKPNVTSTASQKPQVERIRSAQPPPITSDDRTSVPLADRDEETDAGSYDPSASWERERIDFYREELNLSEDDIAAIDAATEASDAALTDLIEAYYRQIDEGIVEPEFVPRGTDRIIDNYNSNVLSILGSERYVRAIDYREAFNDRSRSLHGNELRVRRF